MESWMWQLEFYKCIVLELPLGKQEFKFLKFEKGGITNIKSMAMKVNNGNKKYSAISVGRFFCYKIINLKKKLIWSLLVLAIVDFSNLSYLVKYIINKWMLKW